jgi:hypothetical protein
MIDNPREGMRPFLCSLKSFAPIPIKRDPILFDQQLADEPRPPSHQLIDCLRSAESGTRL